MSEPGHLPWDWYPDPIPDNVEIGDRSWIYSSFAFLHHRSRVTDAVRIGSDTGVYIGTVFETGPHARIEIGDYCTVAGPTLMTHGRISIGDYALVSWGVTIADSFAPTPPEEGEPVVHGAEILIGENVWLGANATILGGARIGDGAIVGALSVVDFEVPSYSIVAGNPGRVVGRAAPREDAAG